MSKKKWPSEPLVLVGFGEHDLADLMADVDSLEGHDRLLNAIDRYHWPPRYRPRRICSEEQIVTFIKYVKWVREQLGDS